MRDAVEAGTLPVHRLNTFRQFNTEVAFQRSRVDERVKAGEKRQVREADNKEYQREKRRKKEET